MPQRLSVNLVHLNCSTINQHVHTLFVWSKFVAPLQGFSGMARHKPRALPWADMYLSLWGEACPHAWHRSRLVSASQRAVQPPG